MTRAQKPGDAARVGEPPLDESASLRISRACAPHAENVLRYVGEQLPLAWISGPECRPIDSPVVGDGAAVTRPAGCLCFDFEVGVAAVIREAFDKRSASTSLIPDRIAGFALMMMWYARDVPEASDDPLRVAVGRHVATSLGPWQATASHDDSLLDALAEEQLAVRLNGEPVTTTSLAEMSFSWGDLIASADADRALRSGDVVGCAGLVFGSLLELRLLNMIHDAETYSWLQDGDIVDVASPMLGSLRAVVRPTGLSVPSHVPTVAW
jgi:2-keto-4-pentenoate hydratase/2-oxohepta-3-ene-1,7-dioic acid hydratase in catechol pathway